MRTSTSTLRAAAVTAVLGAGLLGMPTASAAGSTTAAGATGTPIHSLPFYGTGDVTGVGTGTGGTTATNTAVAKACNGAAPINHPQWYRLPAVALGKVVARVDAPYHPRGVSHNATGVAFVDVLSGNVVGCGTGPVDVATRRQLAVVAYYSQPVDDCTPEQWCAGGSLRLYVNTTVTVPPVNDRWAHARTIPSLPFSGSVDTSVADDDGPAVFDYETCERSAIEPVQRGTVWWRYTPKTTGPAPDVALDVRNRWNGMGAVDGFSGFTPRVAIALLTPAGPVPAPHQDPDDCDSPVLLRAGRTYLFAAYTFQDSYVDATPVTGGAMTIRVGAVPTPRVPTDLEVDVAASTRTATVSWSPPATAGGAGPVTGYVLRVDRRNAQGVWVLKRTVKLPANARTWTSPRMPSTQAYRVRVAAVNGAGGGGSAYRVVSPL
jgi:ribosomal protein S30